MMQHLSKHFILIFDFFKNHDGKEPTKKKKKKSQSMPTSGTAAN